MQTSICPGASLARECGRLRVRLAWAVAAFCALEGPAALGYASLRDYTHSRAGLSLSRFLRLRRVGDFLSACPEVGTLSFSVVDHLAQRCTPSSIDSLLPRLCGRSFREARALIDEHVESERRCKDPPSPIDPTVDPNFERVSFAVPADVAVYLHQTLELASAMLGHDVADSNAVDAVVAEASTEGDLVCDASEARAFFRVRTRQPKPVRLAAPTFHRPRPRFRQRDPHAVRILDRYLRRLASQEVGLQVRLEDRVLSLWEDAAHMDAGFATFAAYARDVLEIPRSTLYDYLDRARARRRGHPIAVACASGAITTVQAQLLNRLHRRCHVPYSALDPWIEAARRITVRGLSSLLDWARTQRDTDYRAWSNAGFPVPTPEEVRTSVRPVHEIAADPSPAILADLSRQPTTTVPWTLQTETLDLLLQLMANHRRKHDPVPSWWCLLRVFVDARKQWSVLEREPSDYRLAIRRRDNYRCVVPFCTQRRGLDVHHLKFRNQGRDDDTSNLGLLCAFHHRALHARRFNIKGKVRRSTDDLIFELGVDENGQPSERFQGSEVIPTPSFPFSRAWLR